MEDADQARRASGAWLASRSKLPEPTVAAFLAMDAMPDLAGALRAKLRRWVQVGDSSNPLHVVLHRGWVSASVLGAN